MISVRNSGVPLPGSMMRRISIKSDFYRHKWNTYIVKIPQILYLPKLEEWQNKNEFVRVLKISWYIKRILITVLLIVQY